MEITIKISSVRELNKIKKLLEGEKINVVVGNGRKKKQKRVNKLTEEVFKKTDRGEDLIICKNVDDFFKKLGI